MDRSYPELCGIAAYASSHFDPNLHAKHAKNGAKTRFWPRFDVSMRNSLPTFAKIREILYSHSPLIRAILVNLPQKIAKPQANAGAPNANFQANI
jgi:hypothetical protein